MTKIYIAFLFLTIGFLFGCTTYHVSTENLLEQFVNSKPEGRGYFFPNAVKGNSLQAIKCMDNNGNIHTIPISDRTQIRITKTDNSRVTFYFNTVVLKDSSVTGSKTHFFNDQIKPIPFSSISKIEIQ